MVKAAAPVVGRGGRANSTRSSTGLHVCCVVLVATIAACNGPNETAGKEQDKATAAALWTPYIGSGPNQRVGEAKDRAVAARNDAKEAAANALRAQGDNIKRQADADAAGLDEQSRAIREAANKKAAALDDQARAARK